MRKLATVREIAEIKDIEGADRIVAYRVDGWWVVGQKGDYKVGDEVIYLEVDSWVPTTLAPFLSRGKEPREFNGVQGERLKTIKLKGQISQGLLLPKSILDDIDHETLEWFSTFDLDSYLNIQKWEMPVRLNRFGQVCENRQARKGGFPWFIPKSDQERLQNIPEKRFLNWISNSIPFEATEKLDGSSMTIYSSKEGEGDEGVCSRNINLKRPEEGENNHFWAISDRDGLLDKVKRLEGSYAFQGELIGPGIQNNPYKLDRHEFFCYNIWDISKQEWVLPKKRREMCKELDINHVPVIGEVVFIEGDTMQGIIEDADGFSIINSESLREGTVYKSTVFPESFKAISNQFLLKHQ